MRAHARVCDCSALPMAATSIGNVLLGLLGMRLVDVPMFFTLRRLVTPTIVVYEYLALGKTPQRHVAVAVTLIMVGTLIAATPTLSTDLLSYIVVLVTNLFTAANMAYQKQYREATQASVLTIVLVNSILTLPVTLILTYVTGEAETVAQYPYLHHPGFWVAFFASASLGLVLTFAAMLNTTYNSPVATSITGNVKDIATTFFGWLLFPGFRASFASVGGIALSFCGAFWYSYTNLRIGMAALESEQRSKATAITARELGIRAASTRIEELQLERMPVSKS